MNGRSVVPASLFYGGILCLLGLVVIYSDGSAEAVVLAVIAAILLTSAGMKVDHV